MSVAFRRESDEEHKEPRFELPVPPGPNPVTARGYDLLKTRTLELEAAVAAEHDEEARKVLQRDLRYWRARLATAQVAPRPSGDAVAFGTSVTMKQSGRTRSLTIVGHDEADPAENRIAFSAPLARLLMGAEAGDEIDAPGGEGMIEILAVEPA
jgi:transcription elongation GreA/GreB family factor